MAAIRGVLFDKDGTLIDFMGTWRGVTETVLARFAEGDVPLAEALGAAIGYDARTGMFLPGSPIVAGSVDAVASLMAPLLPRWAPRDIEAEFNRIALATGAGDLAPAPDLHGALGRLAARGLRLGVGTHDAEAPARAHLAALGVAARFDFVAGYDSGHGLKPGPGMPQAFARAIGARPAEVVMVGDSVHDMGAGRSAGCALCVAVLTGPATEVELAPHADIVLPSIAELPEYLAGR